MDASDIAHNLRELIELDRGFGVEFVPRAPAVTSEPLALPATSAPARGMTAPTAPASVLVRPPAAARPAAARPVAPAPAVRVAAAMNASPLVVAAPPANDSLEAIATEISQCHKCGLCATRTNTVPGEGNPSPELMFIGEGPGADEDAQGRPFVGVAGQLLDRMIAAMGFARGDVLIANVVKCRPPGNRNPEPDEVAACMPYLHRQIQAAKPKIICTLGNVPLRALFGADQPGITKVRGQRLSWQGITVIPTFHPSYLLRNETAKKPCWEDLLTVLRALGREPPARKK
jgi:uracil-DNA glycosylase